MLTITFCWIRLLFIIIIFVIVVISCFNKITELTSCRFVFSSFHLHSFAILTSLDSVKATIHRSLSTLYCQAVFVDLMRHASIPNWNCYRFSIILALCRRKLTAMQRTHSRHIHIYCFVFCFVCLFCIFIFSLVLYNGRNLKRFSI